MNNEILSYDTRNDILFIHKGFSSDEKFNGNLDIGDLILDMSTKNRIRGIEIMNACKFFKVFNITEEILENLTGVEFTAQMQQNGVIISLIFKSLNKEIPAKIAVPLEN